MLYYTRLEPIIMMSNSAGVSETRASAAQN